MDWCWCVVLRVMIMEHNAFWSVVRDEFLWFKKDGLEIVSDGDSVMFKNIRVVT